MRVTLRIPDELHRRLQDRSRRAGASLNQTIVAVVSDALAQDEAAVGDGSANALHEQVRHIRTALGDLTVEIDADRLPPHQRPDAGMPDRAAFIRSLPRLDPPLSATIIAGREDRF